MMKVEKVLEIASGEIGYKESGNANNNKYGIKDNKNKNS